MEQEQCVGILSDHYQWMNLVVFMVYGQQSVWVIIDICKKQFLLETLFLLGMCFVDELFHCVDNTNDARWTTLYSFGVEVRFSVAIMSTSFWK